MDYVLLWIIFSIVAGAIASSRGRSGWGWFFLALIISPLVAVIAVAVMPVVHDGAVDQLLEVQCPFCGGSVPTRAGICRHCSRKLPSRELLERHAYRPCPKCAEPIRREAVKCKHCSSEVEAAPRWDGVDRSTGSYGLGRSIGEALASGFREGGAKGR